jgi:mRNA-decapping enzyme subunit 2
MSETKTEALTLSNVFEDIVARFFANLPASEINSSDRMFVQLTEAHWFFEDFYSDQHEELPRLNFRQFCAMFFKLQPLFSAQGKYILSHFDELLASFRDYMGAVSPFESPLCLRLRWSPSLC